MCCSIGPRTVGDMLGPVKDLCIFTGWSCCMPGVPAGRKNHIPYPRKMCVV